MSDDISPEARREIAETRARLSLHVVYWAGGGIAAMAGLAIVSAALVEACVKGDATEGITVETIRMVFTSVLPLLGTWVGTVLAFYFTKEGLETASRTTLAAVRSGLEKLEQTPIRDKMIATSAITALRLGNEQNPMQATYGTIDGLFAKTIPGTSRPITRLPVIDATEKAVAIIHDSAWTALQNVCLKAGVKLEAATTLQAMVDAAKTAKAATDYETLILKSFAFVAVGGTFADAKRQMEASVGAQDVFVTATGAAGEPVLGWLPNVLIAKESRA